MSFQLTQDALVISPKSKDDDDDINEEDNNDDVDSSDERDSDDGSDQHEVLVVNLMYILMLDLSETEIYSLTCISC